MIIKGYKAKQFKSIISKLCVDDVLRDYTIVIYKYKFQSILSNLFLKGLWAFNSRGVCNPIRKRIEIYTFVHKIKSTKDLNSIQTLFHEIYHAIQYYKYNDCLKKDRPNYRCNYDNCWTERTAESYANHNMIKFKSTINRVFDIRFKWHIRKQTLDR